MEQSKIISVDVDISLKETNIRTLDAVLFSRDINAPKIRFNITKDGNEISDSASVSLLLTASNSLGTLRDGLNVKLNGNVTGGEATFVLPNDILGYEGFVRADIYVYWENGSNDGTQPILFSVKRSALDSTASTMSVVYVDEFEIEKTRVTKAADDAIGTIDTNETIQQFEADKKAVSDAKDLAVTEINARPAELDGVISTATAEINAKSDSVYQTASVAKNQINADVLAVDNAKDTAIATINATPSKLDEPINNAKNAISQSVNNVSNAETGAIATINTAISAVDSAKITATDSFNQGVDDVQNASVSAVSEIEAVKPDMMQQINDIKTNINTLVGLQQTSAIQKKIQTAWAWSADGTDRFTTVYPNLNLLDGTRDFSGADWINVSGVPNDGTFKGLAIKSKSYQWNGLYKSYTVPEDGDYTFSTYVSASADGVNPAMIISKNSTVIKNTVLLTTMFDMQRFNYVCKDLKKGDVVSGRIDKSGTATGKVSVAGHKWEPGSTATPWMPSSREVTTADYPKYRGIGVLSSVTPTDYQWEQSDTYRDYKEQQLKTAIIALGGTL